MTEEEAKTKWCPFARVDSTAANRPNPGPNCDVTAGWPPCIGSACMAWRVLGEPIERAEGYVMGFIPQGDGWQCTLSDKGREGFQIKSQWERNVPVQGYCGLADKP